MESPFCNSYYSTTQTLLLCLHRVVHATVNYSFSVCLHCWASKIGDQLVLVSSFFFFAISTSWFHWFSGLACRHLSISSPNGSTQSENASDKARFVIAGSACTRAAAGRARREAYDSARNVAAVSQQAVPCSSGRRKDPRLQHAVPACAPRKVREWML